MGTDRGRSHLPNADRNTTTAVRRRHPRSSGRPARQLGMSRRCVEGSTIPPPASSKLQRADPAGTFRLGLPPVRRNISPDREGRSAERSAWIGGRNATPGTPARSSILAAPLGDRAGDRNGLSQPGRTSRCPPRRSRAGRPAHRCRRPWRARAARRRRRSASSRPRFPWRVSWPRAPTAAPPENGG